MVTLQVQQMPHGYDLETPSFFYWMRAGAALMLGAGVVYVGAAIVWVWLMLHVPSLLLLRWFRAI